MLGCSVKLSDLRFRCNHDTAAGRTSLSMSSGPPSRRSASSVLTRRRLCHLPPKEGSATLQPPISRRLHSREVHGERGRGRQSRTRATDRLARNTAPAAGARLPARHGRRIPERRSGVPLGPLPTSIHLLKSSRSPAPGFHLGCFSEIAARAARLASVSGPPCSNNSAQPLTRRCR